MSLAIYWRYIG